MTEPTLVKKYRLLTTGTDEIATPAHSTVIARSPLASDSEEEMSGIWGLTLLERQRDAIVLAVRSDPLLPRLEATAAHSSTFLQGWLP